jgi:POT family proton-dependent oligopeptide transporter
MDKAESSYRIFLENYIQNSPDDPLHPGALGLGQSKATMLVNIFLILGYTTPMAAGCLADNYLGRYKVILISLMCVILRFPSILYSVVSQAYASAIAQFRECLHTD